MANFINGSGLESFEAWACSRCVNMPKGQACPLIDAHVIFRGMGDEVNMLLDLLIPEFGMEPCAPGGKVLCALFRPKDASDTNSRGAWAEATGQPKKETT